MTGVLFYNIEVQTKATTSAHIKVIENNSLKVPSVLQVLIDLLLKKTLGIQE